MDRTIQVIWWIGLAGALMATLAVLLEVMLVLRALSSIDRFARTTREAARGIARNVEVISGLTALNEPVHNLAEGTGALGSAATALASRLEVLSGDRRIS